MILNINYKREELFFKKYKIGKYNCLNFLSEWIFLLVLFLASMSKFMAENECL